MEPDMQRLTARGQAGITLIEVLLAMGISVVMLSALAYLLFDSQQELSAKNTAERMQAFQRVAAQYYTAHRSYLLDAMDGDDSGEGAVYCQINIPEGEEVGSPAFSLEKHTCMIDASLLRARRLLPESLSVQNEHGERFLAVFRRIYDEDDLPTANVEMLVLTVLDQAQDYAPNRKRYTESLSVASNLGATGGVLPDGDRGNCLASRSQSLFEVCGNGWKVALNDFLDDAQLGNFTALLNN